MVADSHLSHTHYSWAGQYKYELARSAASADLIDKYTGLDEPSKKCRQFTFQTVSKTICLQSQKCIFCHQRCQPTPVLSLDRGPHSLLLVHKRVENGQFFAILWCINGNFDRWYLLLFP